MNLPEPINWINKRLLDEYGMYDLKRPNWRVVWSEDQFEKRLGTFTDSRNGIFVREVTEIREVPKYRQWIHEKYVLERLTVVPEMNIEELLGEKLSYEPCWVFETEKGIALPPLFRAAKFVIETIGKQIENTGGMKYRDPDSDPKEAMERKQERIEQLQMELFGNETNIGDALMQDHGVGFGVRKRNDAV